MVLAENDVMAWEWQSAAVSNHRGERFNGWTLAKAAKGQSNSSRHKKKKAKESEIKGKNKRKYSFKWFGWVQ